jgi:hypothetical protein
MSQFHYLTDEEITASIDKNAVHVRAAALDEATRFLVLTVPADSRYAHPDSFSKLISALTSLSLRPKSYRAADSEDIQIFLPFSEHASTAALHKVLSRELMQSGFEISPQTLVIHSTVEPFAMPLQAKFAWLNDNLTVKLLRDDIALESAIALFLADIARSSVEPSVLLNCLSTPIFEDTSIESVCSEVEHSANSSADKTPAATENDPVSLTKPQALTAQTANSSGTQLQLFPTAVLQSNIEEPIPIRQKRRRPRSDPQAARAEPHAANPEFFPSKPEANSGHLLTKRRFIKESN